jgi:hypothetical protein
MLDNKDWKLNSARREFEAASRTTLYWHGAGLRICYERDFNGEMLYVEDLNPEKAISFRMTPIELLKFGFKCIWAACRG